MSIGLEKSVGEDKTVKQEIATIIRDAMGNYTYKNAIEKIEKILKKHPILRDEQRLCDLATLYDHLATQEKNASKRKKYEETAFGLCRSVLKINPGSIYDAYALWGIGRIWWHRKNIKAIKYAKAATKVMKKVTGKDGGMSVSVGVVYDDLGNIRQAEYWYLKAIKENPDQLGLYYNLTNFYYKNNLIKKQKHYLPILKRMYGNESEEFKQTKWGRSIGEKIQEMDKTA